MKLGFDPAKNTRNIKERGLSFNDIAGLDWDNAIVVEDNRKDYGETHYRAFVYGTDGKPYSVAFTIRGDVIWVISFRRAREKERRLYE